MARGPEVSCLSQEKSCFPYTWLIPKRQNVLVRDICMPTLLGCSKRELPQLSPSAGWQNAIRGFCEQSQTGPFTPSCVLLSSPCHAGTSRRRGGSPQPRACASYWCGKDSHHHHHRRPFTAVRPSEVQSKMPG